jgi:hypothetical protein
MLKGLQGMGDMMGLMKKAQKMKNEMKKLKKEISKTNITVKDENNDITIIINGDHIIQKIIFSENVENFDNKKLSSLIKDTINKSSKEVEKMSSEKMSVLSKQGMPTDLPF